MKHLGRSLSLVTVSVFLLSLSFLECDRPLDLNNPFDPTVPLPPPSDLKLISLTENSLSIQWKDNTHINSSEQDANAWIIVEQSLDNATFSAMDSLSVSSLSGTVYRRYLLNQTYYFRIHKRVGSRATSSTNTVSGVVMFSSPYRFKVDSLSESRRRFTWQWQQGSEPPAGFRIERKSGGGPGYLIVGQAPPNAFTFVDTTIIRTDTLYLYRVCALTGGGTPSLYDSLSLSIPFPAPTGLTCSGTSPNAVSIGWTSNGPFPTESAIERGVGGSNFVPYAIVPSGVNTFTDTVVDKQHSFHYRVTSKSRYNVSPASIVRCGFQITDARLLQTMKTPITPYTGERGILSEDCTLFLSVGSYQVVVMDFTSGTYLRTIRFAYSFGAILSVALSKNKEVFAVVGLDGTTTYLYRTADGSGICAFRSSWPGGDVALSDDGSQVMLSFGNGELQCRRIADTSLVWRSSLPEGPTSLWVHPDGKRLLAGNGERTYVLDVQTGTVISSSAGGNFGRTPSISPTGDILVVVANTCYNVTQNRIEFSHPDLTSFYWISKDMLYVAFADQDRYSGVLSVATGKAIFPFESLSGYHSYIRLIDNDQKVVTYNWEGDIDVWGLFYNWSTF